MNANKKLYLYSGLAIALAVVSYIVITNKKNLVDSGVNTSTDEEGNVVVTPTGEIIDEEQAIIPDTLREILKKDSAKATVDLINKPIYTKIDGVKVRYENFVNNGIINNIMSTITNTGTLLGNIIEVKDDKGKLKNSDGRVLKWFRIKPSKIALEDMNRNKGFLTHVFLPESTAPIFTSKVLPLPVQI
jgi:hypothetical protein